MKDVAAMPEIKLQPLAARLSPAEIQKLAAAAERKGTPTLPSQSGAELILDDDVFEPVLDEILDKLESYGSACDIYLPVKFDGQIMAGDLAVGSATALLESLAELREQIEEEEGGSSIDEDIDLADLLDVLTLLRDGAIEALDRGMPLHVVR